jgi:hypothetical protein
MLVYDIVPPNKRHFPLKKRHSRVLAKALTILTLLAILLQAVTGLFGAPQELKAAGTTYYVDCNAANDSGAGTAPGTAWKTIAKVNGSSFSPGDSILFNKGCTWREQLNVSSSGSAGNPITFDSYGSSSAPVISGADLGTGWTSTTVNPDAYFSFNGSDANVIDTPATTSTELTGTNFRLEADVQLTSYNSTASQVLMAKDDCCSDGASARHWGLTVLNNQTLFGMFHDNSFTPIVFGVNNLGVLANNTRYKLRVDVTPNDGAGHSNAKFYYSTDGITYTQYGGTQTSASTTVNAVNSTAVSIGRRIDDLGSPYASTLGKMFRARAWSDLTGTTLVSDMNPASATSGQSTFSSGGATWTIEGAPALTPAATTTLYWISQSSYPYQVFEDGVRMTSSSPITAMPVGSYFYDGSASRLYIRTFVDDSPSGHTIEISNRPYGIYEAGGQTYITVSSLQVQMAATGIYFNASNHVTVSGVLAQNNFYDGIHYDVTARSTIVSSTAAYNGENGIAGADVPVLLISQSVAHDNDVFRTINFSAGIKINPDYAPYASSTNVTIQDSVAYSNGAGQAASGMWLGAGIWADTIYSGLLVQRNLVYNNNLMGIYLDAGNNQTAAYNIAYGNGQSGAVDGGGIAVYGDGRTTGGNSVYNNTVYGNRKAGINIQGSNLSSGCMNNTAKNNIAVSTVSGQNFLATNGCENSGVNGSGNVYTYNAFGPEQANFIQWGSGVYKSTYAAFDAAYGSSAHSVPGDPLFTNAGASNFTLQSISPAIDTGSSLGSTYAQGLNRSSTWPNNVVLLDQTTQGSGWDLGAYVYTQSTLPTVSITSPANNATVSGGAIPFSANASVPSPAAITSVQFKLDGQNLSSAITTPPYAYSWNSLSSPDGSHTLQAVATDNYGNQASAQASFTLANPGTILPPAYGTTYATPTPSPSPSVSNAPIPSISPSQSPTSPSFSPSPSVSSSPEPSPISSPVSSDNTLTTFFAIPLALAPWQPEAPHPLWGIPRVVLPSDDSFVPHSRFLPRLPVPEVTARMKMRRGNGRIVQKRRSRRS